MNRRYEIEENKIYNFWIKRILYTEIFSFEDFLNIKNYLEDYSFIPNNYLEIFYYHLSYGTKYKIKINLDLILKNYIEKIDLIEEKRNFIENIFNDFEFEIIHNDILLFIFQRFLIDSTLEIENISLKYTFLFSQYKKFYTNNYYDLFKKNESKNNLLDMHIYIEYNFLKLIASYKLNEIDVFIKIYNETLSKINHNIFLEKYKYRLSVVTNYLKIINYDKLQNNVINKNQIEQTALNKNILNFYQLI